MPSSKQRVAVVTGANAGLGYQLSLTLARMGAHVVMACRSAQRAAQAKAQLQEEAPGAKVTTLRLDLSELDSIREFARLFGEQLGRLDILIHNAGVFGLPPTRNALGHEMHFATNYLGAFTLTGLVLPHLRDEHGTRIVTVGSLSNRFGKLRLDELDLDEANYSEWAAYARSKLALLSYTVELNRRLRERGSRVTAVGAHPGMAPTEGARKHSAAKQTGRLGQWFKAWAQARLPSVAEAARPILHAALADDVRGGEYYGPSGWFEIGGVPGRARVAAPARDARLAAQLWSVSEALTGVRYLSAEEPPAPAHVVENERASSAEPSMPR